MYKVLYPKLHGMAATTRILLALSGTRWESIYPSEWSPVEKENVPLGVMPVLYEIHHRHQQQRQASEGAGFNPESWSESVSADLVLEIPESEAIERYLARKFGLIVMSLYVNKVLLAFPDTKERELAKFVTKHVPQWIAQHEKWLARNGFNGFYVGDQA
ncbi:hypothetical protein BGZ65_012399, partial [Modicella reniformis]